jgi:hypothetical protein
MEDRKPVAKAGEEGGTKHMHATSTRNHIFPNVNIVIINTIVELEENSQSRLGLVRADHECRSSLTMIAVLCRMAVV